MSRLLGRAARRPDRQRRVLGRCTSSCRTTSDRLLHGSAHARPARQAPPDHPPSATAPAACTPGGPRRPRTSRRCRGRSSSPTTTCRARPPARTPTGGTTNPTWHRLEQAISRTGGPGDPAATTLAFSSGMAAVSAVLLSQVRSGRRRACCRPTATRRPARSSERLESYGVTVRLAPTAGDAQLAALRRRPAAVAGDAVEPGPRRVRHPAAGRRRARGGRAGRRRQHPGHPARPAPAGARRRLLAGQRHQGAHRPRRPAARLRHHARRRRWPPGVRQWRKTVGAIPGPMEAWLAHRSLATLRCAWTGRPPTPSRWRGRCATAPR